MASFLATPTQYFPAPFSGHTRPKPVRSDPALVSRAVGRLTHAVLQPGAQQVGQLYSLKEEIGKRSANLSRS